MPVFVISLLSQFVYQPVISKMALLWHEEKLTQFKKLIWKQVSLIFLLSIAAVIGGYLLGIPVLSLVYGVNLKKYKTAFINYRLSTCIFVIYFRREKDSRAFRNCGYFHFLYSSCEWNWNCFYNISLEDY